MISFTSCCSRFPQGFCVFPTGVALVSELVEHGSIDDLIHAPNAATAMSLHQRIKLLLDVARGLNWLHCSNPRIVHCDVHAANLLLDNNWNVKIWYAYIPTVQVVQFVHKSCN